MKQSLKHNFEHGIPFEDLEVNYHKPYVESALNTIVNRSVDAHKDLYNAFAAQDTSVVAFDDEHSGEPNKYISFKKDQGGAPFYGCWDPARPTTDIGVRGINPDFSGESNQTTVFHADWATCKELGMDSIRLKSLSETMIALSSLHRFVTNEIARPFLKRVGKTFGEDPDAYADKFLPIGARHNSLTRAILYHDTFAKVQSVNQPIGSDGSRLLIKEHNDQGSFSMNLYQSSAGLQYRLGEDWVDSARGISVFRGAGEDFLQPNTPASLHRVVQQHPDVQRRLDGPLKYAGLARIAIVTFISPVDSSARIVKPNSPETHPTENLIKAASSL